MATAGKRVAGVSSRGPGPGWKAHSSVSQPRTVGLARRDGEQRGPVLPAATHASTLLCVFWPFFRSVSRELDSPLGAALPASQLSSHAGWDGSPVSFESERYIPGKRNGFQGGRNLNAAAGRGTRKQRSDLNFYAHTRSISAGFRGEHRGLRPGFADRIIVS